MSLPMHHPTWLPGITLEVYHVLDKELGVGCEDGIQPKLFGLQNIYRFCCSLHFGEH